MPLSITTLTLFSKLKCEIWMNKIVNVLFYFFLIIANVLALGEEADFEVLNCQLSTKVDTKHNA